MPVVRPIKRPILRSILRGITSGYSQLKKVLISLEGAIPNTGYLMSSPWTAAGDFESTLEFSTSATSGINILIGDLESPAKSYAYVDGATGVLISRLGLSVITSGTTVVNDGAMYKLKFTRSGSTVSFYINDAFEFSITGVSGGVSFITIGYNSSANNFDGIISNVKLRDIDTPSNTEQYSLGNLTGDTETSNGNTLTYNNIAETQDVRDTYRLLNGYWIGTELTTNGDFATDSDWTKGSGWSIASNLATCDGTSSSLSQTQEIIEDALYRVIYTVSGLSAGSITAQVGGTSGTSRSLDGTYTEDIICGSSAVFALSSSGFIGNISNVSVKRIIENAS